MLLNVDFLCFDERPLHKEKDLVGFLKLLHEENGAIMSLRGKKNPRRTYYRGIGCLNTKKQVQTEVAPAYFKTRNSIRFPAFEVHKVKEFKSDKYWLVRNKTLCVRRYFTTNLYGIANRLEFGFEFALEIKKGEENRSVKENKTSFEILKSIFEMEVNTGDRKAGNLKVYPFWELGEVWLPRIVEDSTRCKKYPKKVEEKKVKEGEKEVVGCAATAVLVYEEGELQELPLETNGFRLKDNPYNIDISWFDYKAHGGANNIKVYFVRTDGKCSSEFLRDLVSTLFELRDSYACLEQILCKRELSAKSCVCKSLLSNIEKIRDSEKHGFLDTSEEGSDKIYGHEIRKEISRRCCPTRIPV